MLKSLCRAIIFGLVFCAPAGTVAAQDTPQHAPIDLIAALNDICVAAQGDQAQAAALAAEHGFSPVPESMVPRIRNSANRAGFMRTNATDVSLVMTGTMTRRLSGETVVMEFCGVSAQPADHRAVDARLRQVMGFAPVAAGGMEAYAWLHTPEGRAPSRSISDPQFIAMAQTGQMRMVGLDRTGRGSTLLYILPRVD
jgi:hypothetical protein